LFLIFSANSRVLSFFFTILKNGGGGVFKCYVMMGFMLFVACCVSVWTGVSPASWAFDAAPINAAGVGVTSGTV
jgi:hypothetical protein